MEPQEDRRTIKQLLTEYRKLEEVRRALVRQGRLNGDATPHEIIAELRRTIPVGWQDEP